MIFKKPALLLIIVAIIGMLLMVYYYINYGHKTFVTGTIEINYKDSFLKIDDIHVKETNHKQKVLLWEEDDTIYYKMETKGDNTYNIQIEVAGDKLEIIGLRGSTLCHNFSMSTENSKNTGEFDVMIEYCNKYGIWLADVQISGMTKVNLLKTEFIESKEIFFIEKQKQTKTVFW